MGSPFWMLQCIGSHNRDNCENAFHKAELKINVSTGMEDAISFNELTLEFAKLNVKIVAQLKSNFFSGEYPDDKAT